VDGGREVKELRASSLPKLAECSLFEGARGASEAAERGTRMDLAFRLVCQGKTTELNKLPRDQQEAIAWAVEEVEKLAKEEFLETREERLAMDISALSTVGTADILCDRQQWVGDLKTGQVRSYYHQMAAYSLACMERTFTDSWTAHVLYCDQRVRRTYEFDFKTAKAVVEKVISDSIDTGAKPTPCEYCDWCGRKSTCTAIVAQSKAAVALATSTESLDAIRDRILANPETVSEFARQWKRAEKDIAEPVLRRLRELAEADQAPGWSLTQVTGREYVESDAIAKVAKDLPVEAVILAMGGKMSGKQFREWCAAIGAPVDETSIKTGEGTTTLRQQKVK
jgi:predicted nucleic acid-binding protein